MTRHEEPDLEVDRGTMTVKRFTQKLLAYAAYFREGKHKDKYGVRGFRVLTVTGSAKRQENLVTAARAPKELEELQQRFLFTTEDALSLRHPETIFGLHPLGASPAGSWAQTKTTPTTEV